MKPNMQPETRNVPIVLPKAVWDVCEKADKEHPEWEPGDTIRGWIQAFLVCWLHSLTNGVPEHPLKPYMNRHGLNGDDIGIPDPEEGYN